MSHLALRGVLRQTFNFDGARGISGDLEKILWEHLPDLRTCAGMVITVLLLRDLARVLLNLICRLLLLLNRLQQVLDLLSWVLTVDRRHITASRLVLSCLILAKDHVVCHRSDVAQQTVNVGLLTGSLTNGRLTLGRQITRLFVDR